jgi:wobble nucleotide-excising tRNase
MLEKLIRIENVGIFKDSKPGALTFKKATLIYAENARGKSTLAAILRSLAANDPAVLTSRATFGGGPAKVELRFVSASGAFNATFDSGAWKKPVPEVLVFDQEFVERNVHAGSEVTSDHHQSLLEFALGSAAVKKKQEVDNAGVEQVAATKRRTSEEDKLKGYMGQTSLADFKKLPKEADAPAKIAEIAKQIEDGKVAGNINARPLLQLAPILKFDFNAFNVSLRKSLAGLHAEIEAAVKAHIAHCAGSGAEDWVSQGLSFAKGDVCPFCGQDTGNVSLIQAYQTYFDASYKQLQSEVGKLPAEAARALAADVFTAVSEVGERNRERVNTWAPQISLQLPELDCVALIEQATPISTLLVGLAAQKKQAPLKDVEAEEALKDAAKGLESIDAQIGSYNEKVALANGAIATFKERLASADTKQLEKQLQALQRSVVRHSPEVIAIVEAQAAADNERNGWEAQKNKARKDLDTLMSTVLGSFQADINAWLAKFGAPFKVEKMKANYLGGGTPRTEYGLAFGGTVVPAGKKTTGPSFHSALSDGDKRTLALAFFFAKTFAEKHVGEQIVVMDDIFTSLDRQRRTQTCISIDQLAGKCCQVIVMAHDAYFLRDLSQRLSDRKTCDQVVLQIQRIQHGHSDFDTCDLDVICSSDYYKRYENLQNYLDGKPTPNLLPVAQDLRPLIEGHLHKRFPGRLKQGVTLGLVLDQIKNANPANPLAALQPSLQGLHALNDFAGQFHHDTDGAVPVENVTDAELRAFGQQAMRLIHSGQLQ